MKWRNKVTSSVACCFSAIVFSKLDAVVVALLWNEDVSSLIFPVRTTQTVKTHGKVSIKAPVIKVRRTHTILLYSNLGTVWTKKKTWGKTTLISPSKAWIDQLNSTVYFIIFHKFIKQIITNWSMKHLCCHVYTLHSRIHMISVVLKIAQSAYKVHCE